MGYLDDVLRPLVSVLPKMSEYVKTFKDKCRNKTLYQFMMVDTKEPK